MTYDSQAIIEARIRRPRTFVLTANLSAPVVGGFKDWPSEVQDGVFAAMERLIRKTGVYSVDIISAYGANDMAPLPPYIVVTVAEVLSDLDVVISGNTRH